MHYLRFSPFAWRICWFLLAAATSLSMSALAWPTVAPDMLEYVLPWYRHILDHGPIGAFTTPFSNYTPAYLYLLAAGSLLDPWLPPLSVIKLISLVGTGLLAASVHALLGAAQAPYRLEAAVAIFILPTPLINGPFLGQCDAFWVAACVMAVASALERRTRAMLLWCGFAIAFKAQAAFLAPFVIALLLRQRAKWHQWLIPPAAYGAIMLPAWLAGWPLIDLVMVYPLQSAHFAEAGNLANPWVAMRHLADNGGQDYFWIGYGAAAVAALAYGGRLATMRLDRPRLLAAALVPALMLPWLLPKMHERYWLLADVLAFALAVTLRTRPALLIALAVNFASIASLFSYFTNWSLPAILASIVSGLGLLLLLNETFSETRCDATTISNGPTERLAVVIPWSKADGNR